MDHIKRLRGKTALFGLALALFSINASADSISTPTSLDGAVVVDAEQVKTFLESGVLVLDVRVANEYVDKCIKGAKNLPYKEKSVKAVDFDASLDSFDLSRLPADKSAALVFYCNAGQCWKSYKAATVAVRAGYRQVYWFREGLPAWLAKGYPIE